MMPSVDSIQVELHLGWILSSPSDELHVAGRLSWLRPKGQAIAISGLDCLLRPFLVISGIHLWSFSLLGAHYISKC